MYVLIPLLLSVICSFVNPYVGLFGLFTIVEMIILFCVDINANIRIRSSFESSLQNPAHAEQSRKSGKTLATAECVLAVFFTVITTIVEIGVWMLASGRISGDTTVMTPLHIVPEGRLEISCILLMISIALQIMAVILAFIRRGQLIKNSLSSEEI